MPEGTARCCKELPPHCERIGAGRKARKMVIRRESWPETNKIERYSKEFSVYGSHCMVLWLFFLDIPRKNKFLVAEWQLLMGFFLDL
jgi:hypothetical protein